MLLARRNEGLEEILKDCLAKIKATPTASTSGGGGGGGGGKKNKSKGEKVKMGGGR